VEGTPATQEVAEAPVVEEDIAVRKLRAAFPDAVQSVSEFRGQRAIVVAPERIVDACHLLKTDRDLQFDQLVDITAVDYLGREPRYDVVYHLLSHIRRVRVRLKAPVSDAAPRLASVTGVWRAANFAEREVFDLFGIQFDGHPDLRRILLPEHWEGYPLRRDHPVGGEEVGFTS
jgi:NADH-quinone oxidoreductase subunit C